jgi:hypothetical protein
MSSVADTFPRVVSALRSSLPPPQNAATKRGLSAAGCLRLLQRRWLADISTHSVFSHTQNPPRRKGRQPAGSLSRSTLGCTSHEPLTGAARPPPWRCQRRQPRRSGSLLLLVAPSSGRHASMLQIGSLGSPMRRPCRLWLWLRRRPSGPPHRLACCCRLDRGVTTCLHLAAWSLGSPTKHVCRYGCANSVSRASRHRRRRVRK